MQYSCASPSLKSDEKNPALSAGLSTIIHIIQAYFLGTILHTFVSTQCRKNQQSKHAVYCFRQIRHEKWWQGCDQ